MEGVLGKSSRVRAFETGPLMVSLPTARACLILLLSLSGVLIL
jgi:hypothetical protein